MTVRSDERRVIESLAAFAAIPEWLAAPMEPDRVATSLRRHVKALTDGEVNLLGCSPDRLRAKEDAWLVRYTVGLEWPDGDTSDLVLVGQLFPPHVQLPSTGAVTESVALGEPGWTCTLPDLRLELRAEAADHALPSLPGLVDPTSVAELLEPLLRDAGHPDAVIETCEPEVVRYKPGSRCTVVVHVGYAEPHTGSAPPNPVVLKTHQGDKGEAAWAAMVALWERPDTWRDVVRLAEPLAYLRDRRILVQGPVPEECTLKELARDAIATADPERLSALRLELTKTATALAAVHRSGARYGRTATLEDELAEVAEVVERLALSVPELGEAAGALLSALTTRAAEVPSDPPVPAHHDFRPAQVLLHGGALGFIDFDGASMAEPALDLGRFRAKLRDIGISALGPFDGGTTAAGVPENLALLDELCDHFLASYQEHAPVSSDRVLLWEACDLFTTMLHAWTKVRLLRLQPRLTTLVHHLQTSGVLTAT